MYSVRLKVFPGTYNNETAYKNVINYVTAKALWGGYGFFPYDPESIVTSFEKSHFCSHQTGERLLWHFSITFSQKFDINYLFSLGNEISLAFANQYQVVFSVDTEHRPHLHFVINAFSFYPETVTLSPILLKDICCRILSKLHNSNPLFQHTTLDFPKEVL